MISVGLEDAVAELLRGTAAVPEEVPSLFQSTLPVVPSSVRKNSVPLILTSEVGEELLLPGTISFTRLVPAAVPSLLQSSTPLVPSLTVKNSVPAALTNKLG